MTSSTSGWEFRTPNRCHSCPILKAVFDVRVVVAVHPASCAECGDWCGACRVVTRGAALFAAVVVSRTGSFGDPERCLACPTRDRLATHPSKIAQVLGSCLNQVGFGDVRADSPVIRSAGSTIRGRSRSSKRGSPTIRPACCTWPGCGGPTASSARPAGRTGAWQTAKAQVDVRGLRPADVGDRGDDLPSDPDAVVDVVRGDLVPHFAEERHVRAGSAAGAGVRVVRDRVGVAAEAPTGHGPARPGPALGCRRTRRSVRGQRISRRGRRGEGQHRGDGRGRVASQPQARPGPSRTGRDRPIIEPGGLRDAGHRGGVDHQDRRRHQPQTPAPASATSISVSSAWTARNRPT